MFYDILCDPVPVAITYDPQVGDVLPSPDYKAVITALELLVDDVITNCYLGLIRLTKREYWLIRLPE